jgi:hypothetical protein
MTKADAIKMTKPELAEILAAKRTKNVASRAEWVKAYLRNSKGYLVALLVEQTTRKNSKDYPAAREALTKAAQSVRR